jgi:hypothetical protein
VDEREFSRSSIGKDKVNRSFDSQKPRPDTVNDSLGNSTATAPINFGVRSVRSKSPDLTPNVVPLSTEALALLHRRVKRMIQKSETMVMLEDQIRNNRENIDKALTLIRTRGGTGEIDDIVQIMSDDFVSENKQKEVYLRVQAELEKYEDLKKIAVSEIVEDLHHAQALQNKEEEMEVQQLENKKTQMATVISSKQENTDQQKKFTEIIELLTSYTTENSWFGKLAKTRGADESVPEGDLVTRIKFILGQAEEVISKILIYKRVTTPQQDPPEQEWKPYPNQHSPRSTKEMLELPERNTPQAKPLRIELKPSKAGTGKAEPSPKKEPMGVQHATPQHGSSQQQYLRQKKTTSVASSLDTEPYTKSRGIGGETPLPKVYKTGGGGHGSKDDSMMNQIWSQHSRDHTTSVTQRANANVSFDSNLVNQQTHTGAMYRTTTGVLYNKNSRGARQSLRTDEKELQLELGICTEVGLINLREYRQMYQMTLESQPHTKQMGELERLLKKNVAPATAAGSPRKAASNRFFFPKIDGKDGLVTRKGNAHRTDARSVELVSHAY